MARRLKSQSAKEAAEADARMQHFLKCLRFQRIYEAAVRARLRKETECLQP